jgi:hypothetical protein
MHLTQTSKHTANVSQNLFNPSPAVNTHNNHLSIKEDLK